MKLDVLTEEQRKFIEETGPMKLYEIIYDLTDQLSAERARRIKAEEVVDAIIANEGCCIQHADESAQSYRAQYPRVEKENE